ncbi:ATP-binding cassette domain-containing protein [Maricaulis sp.]|uniref:ABC transporter ATP-binding protein n=1 Tax=Maricaulis sp. TaxID=1486257 RepID=UPI00262C7B7F|nr:ATP-binding cassette domain-containing protein [Maricaulis sp.]
MMPGRPAHPAAIDIGALRHAWPGEADILRIDRFHVAAGERVFLAGPSGSGKSTLLGLIAGITPCQQGRVAILGDPVGGMSPARRDAHRAAHIGVIFQLFNLVPYLSALENTLLPLRFSPQRAERVRRTGQTPVTEARRLLDVLGLDETTLGKPATALSIGQQQRVAAARALIGHPGLIIADEPTSALDRESRDGFIDLLNSECARTGAALLFVSHDTALAAGFDRHVDLRDINRMAIAA